jgi:hypothetical protein
MTGTSAPEPAVGELTESGRLVEGVSTDGVCGAC